MHDGSYSQAGFYYQNNLAALKILGLLELDSDILYIELEKFSKGNHIDDIIITRNDEIEFYQVKWSESETNAFTIHNIAYEAIEDQNGNQKLSLWEKLVKGYEKKITDGKNATITLYSTRPAGKTVQHKKSIDKSLADFIEFHQQFIATDGFSLDSVATYPEFKSLLDKLKNEKGPAGDEFAKFLKALRFQLKMPDLKYLKRQLQEKADQLGLESTHIATLLDLVVNWSIKASRIDRKTLLDGLGILGRFVDRISHQFKIDEKLYIENVQLFTQINRALNELESGCILVEGVPGAGKSTALTKYFAQSRDIRFSYYCFIPDDTQTASIRLQGTYFLKSLCNSIENSFSNLNIAARYSDNYQEKLIAYLDILGTMEKRIVFLIDGLDHVHRSTADIDNPLTRNIPAELPSNIFFIVSSQYPEALPGSIRASVLSAPLRHIKIARFGVGKIRAFLKKRNLHLSDSEVDLLLDRSEGIPLYLHYITSRLLDAGLFEFEDIIAEFPKLIGANITSYHARLFQDFENDQAALWVFGLLGGRREFTTIDVLQSILSGAGKNFDRLEIAKVLQRYKYLLKEKEGLYYSIFHNSFREYLVQHTSAIKPVINDGLIAWYAKAPFEEEAYKNHFQHLFDSGRFEVILGMVNDEWITSSWRCYRSIDHIMENLHIAWRAAAERNSLTEFVRVGFLLIQTGAVKSNLENYAIDSTLLFLSAGLTKEAFQTIWNGEYPVLSNKDFFNYYVIRLYEKKKTLIPTSIANQFFNSFLTQQLDERPEREAEPDFGNYLKAKALYNNAQEWINEVNDLTEWLKPDQLKEILSYVADQDKLLHLLTYTTASTELMLKNYAQALLSARLAKKNDPDIQLYLDQIAFEQLEHDEKIALLISMADNNMEEWLASHCNLVRITPYLNNEIITKDPDYVLAPEFLALFSDLKIWYYTDVKNYTLYELQLSKLSAYPGNLYKAISSAAKIWSDWKKGTKPIDLAGALRAIIDLMVIDPALASQIAGEHDGRSFIRYHLHGLHALIFEFFNEIGAPAELKLLIIHWLKVYKSAGFQDHKSHIGFATAIKKQQGLESDIYLLLQKAESLVRIDHDTGELVTNLTIVAAAYGEAGHLTDFNRIYMDILAIACGIYHRKDHQFAEIIAIMPDVHRLDPTGTLNRFAAIYSLLFKIKDAANTHMAHICLSNFVKFINNYYPQLGFQILIKDDLILARDQAMEIVLEPLIEEAMNDQLPYLWAVIRTVGKWGNFDRTDDHHLYSLFVTLFKKLSAAGDLNFIKNCYDHVYHLLAVEHHAAGKIKVLNEILTETGRNFDFLIAPPVVPATAQPINRLEEEQKHREKFLVPVKKLTREEIAQLSTKDFDAIHNYITNYVLAINLNTLTPLWSDFYHNIFDNFGTWFDHLDQPAQLVILTNLQKFRRLFIQIKYHIAAQMAKDRRAVVSGLKLLAQECHALFEGTGLAEFLNGKISYNKIVQLAFNQTQGRSSKLYDAVSDADMLSLVTTSAIGQVTQWVALVRKYSEPPLEMHCLIRLSRVANPWDLELATSLFGEAVDLFENNYISDKRIADELVEWAYSLLPDGANQLLLKVFRKLHQDYTSGIQYDFYQQVKPWADKFPEPEFYLAWYKANYDYNLKLAEGLPEIDTDVEFIRNHQETKSFEEVITDYLITLFDYPVVPVRASALAALFDLFFENAQLMKNYAQHDLPKQPANIVAHFVTLMHALHFNYPADIAEMMNNSAWLLTTGHFNIQQTAADLILALFECRAPVSVELVNDAARIHFTPLIGIPVIFRPSWPARVYAMSVYQEILIREINQKRNSAVDFSKELYSSLIDEGYDKDAALVKEKEIHEHYNTNTYFGALEINGPAYQSIEQGINRLMVKNIKQKLFNDQAISSLQHGFRLYDPTDCFNQRVKKPDEVNWLSSGISPEDFLNFNDADQLAIDFLGRDPDWLTVFESGDQRVDPYPHHYSTYFKCCIFLADPDCDEKHVEKLLQDFTPYFHHDNLYRSEMRDYFGDRTHEEGIDDCIYPLMAASAKNFRGGDQDDLAIVLPHVARYLGLVPGRGILDWNDNQGKPAVELVEWQGPYRDMIRRQYDPLSKGTTVKMRKDLLKDYTVRHHKNLFLHVQLRRSNDNAASVASMHWEEQMFLYKVVI